MCLTVGEGSVQKIVRYRIREVICIFEQRGLLKLGPEWELKHRPR